ncbi:MAG TPA: S9 family peptidase [Gemmatimonadales bacterium]|nr:S9 family peptidase [Gemmatimonadales bacterium]
MPNPPIAPRIPHAHEKFGDIREDPWSWLREKDDPEVRAYLDAENAYAEAELAPLKPLETTIYDEMLARIKQTDLSVAYRDNGWWYYTRTEEGKQYTIHCRRAGTMEAPEEVVLDLNLLAEGHPYLGLGALEISDDNRYALFTTDTTGFREYTLQVKDLVTGALLDERIEKVASAAWAADSRTIVYVTEDHAKRAYKLWRHTLGGATDRAIYEETDERFRIGVGRGRSKRILYLGINSFTTSEARWTPADRPDGEWRVVVPRATGREYDVDDRGERFWFRVNDTGRNFRLVSAPIDDPAPANWREEIPHRDDVMIEGLDLFRDFSVVQQRRDGLQELRVIAQDGSNDHLIAMAEPVYTAGPGTNAEWEATQYRFSYQSFVTPPSVFDYDVRGRIRTLRKQVEVLGGYDPARYESTRVHAEAPDGVQVPISLVWRTGVTRDGSAPMLLSGYGAYGIPYPVGFSSARLSLLDRGVVFAIAHIRGGGDLGKPWHDGGRMMHKMNTFTDFIASAKRLVKDRWTSPPRLVIEGGSAGGLLMGAVTNLRPDLWSAVVSHVPFVDVLTTMLDASLPLTVGEYEEWGDPNDEATYRYIRRYCPWSNIEPKAYPPMYIRTSINDSQVMYWEPAKYVAKLRAMKSDKNQILLLTNMGAGHGGASGRYDHLHELARDYAWMLQQMGQWNTPTTVGSPLRADS